MFTNEQRLRFLMKDNESYFRVKKDRYEYAYGIAIMYGRQIPNEDDYYEGFLAMVDDAMVAYKFEG